MNLKIVDDALPDVYNILKHIRSYPYSYGEKDNAFHLPTGMTHQLSESDFIYARVTNISIDTFEELQDLTVTRAYINYFAPSESSYYHIDGSTGYTVLFYINEDQIVDEGGETQFYNSANHTTFGVLPKPGRMVLSDASLLHRATPFKTKSRFTIAVKFN